MKGPRLVRTGAAALAAVALLSGSGSAATKKRKPAPAPTASPSPTPVPPTPTPEPELRKAAGSCLRYEPGAYIMVSEVGQPGRAFRIDSYTDISVRPHRGARLRIFYVDSPEGPVARKIMPGPVEEN
jgi:hypothetical protein